jgi:ferric-dicitrate binding protein FerR (iron transport regulator)
MTTDRIQYLFERYDEGQATDAETEELFSLLNDPEQEQAIYNFFIEGIRAEQEVELVPADWDAMVRSIVTSLPKEDTEPVLPARGTAKMFRWAATAAAVLVLAAGAWWFLARNKQQPAATPPVAEQRFQNDVQPGTNVPVLTLADGSRVILDSAHSGALATEGTVHVKRLANGEVVYDATEKPTEVRYNTITNPRGSRVVTLSLSDGSRIWLDAASSIRYPTAFVGKERAVEITGQVYFEVAHNASMPFAVRKQGGDAEIEVLGTHFNVMAFDDEAAMKVTLLQGSVKVSKGGRSAVIKPGEQAQVDNSSSAIQVVQDADIDGTMAWKDGVFKFQDITIEPLMKQLARWYDVEVVYEDRPTDRFVSTIPRDVPASQVFKILETTGRVHFKIEGKKVTVMR